MALAKPKKLSPVDLEQLRMFTGGDAVEEAELIALFLQQAQEALATLEIAQARGDAVLWKATAHRFKGASGNFGAMPLHYLCREAEMNSESSTEEKQGMLEAMQEELDCIGGFLGENSPA